MTDSRSQTTVLVTGASGFIALHCILQLLEHGYRARGTLRTPTREPALRNALAKHVDAADRLEFVTADLTRDEGWLDAVRGCTYVLHVASPLPREVPKHEDDLIVPARDGALRVLRAASEAGVKRVVMTSSLAAVCYGHVRDGSRVFDENDWSLTEGIGAYEKSKTIAERAAWDFVGGLPPERRPELVVINPGIVFGPILTDDWGTSGEVVRKLMRREFPGVPRLGWAPVDVRDVASAHLAAMTSPAAAGKRFCCAIEHAWMSDIAAVLNAHFADRGYRIPTRRLPSFLMRVVALFDKTARVALGDLDKRQDVSSARIRQTFGWKPRSLEEMVVSMGESMIEQGVV
jgi:nucleoside-diphosphate-sugar epimerase